MMNIKSLCFLTALSISSLAYSQSGYSSYPQTYNQGSQPYGQQSQFYDSRSQSYQNQPYQTTYGQQGYYQEDSRKAYNDRNQSSNWFGSDKKDQQVPDQVITSQVMQNIRSTSYLSPLTRNIQVETKDGKVTLKGKAFNKNEGYQIEYMAKNIPGVKSVSNDLEYEQ